MHSSSSPRPPSVFAVLCRRIAVMVVLNTQPSTSELKHKKNRRKMAKKPARTASAEGAEDHEMNETSPSAGEGAPSQPQEGWHEGDDDVMIDTDGAAPSQSAAPAFPPLPASAQRSTLKSETRRIPIPPHRMTPLKKDWVNIFSPLTEMLQLQVRMNVQRKSVEIRVSADSLRQCEKLRLNALEKTSKHTKDIGAIQKGADFVKAYALGFDVNVSRF